MVSYSVSSLDERMVDHWVELKECYLVYLRDRLMADMLGARKDANKVE
jgi:hypothetical protein